ARDYEVAYGLSKRTVGPQSDGLVQIVNAYVKDAHRAYVHRSHSGRYGIVNSEEGYQNLQRFLFGDVKIKALLANVNIRSKATDTFYQGEVRVSLRQLPTLVHEQTIGHYCPIVFKASEHTYPIFTAFLLPHQHKDQNRARYAIGLELHSFKQKDHLFSFED